MAVIARMVVQWNGVGVVGPAISTFYFSNPVMTGAPAAVLTYFTALRSFFTNDVSWTVPNSGDGIEDSDGSLVPGWSVTGGGTVTGNATGHNFAEGVGLRVVWDTTGIFARRRVKGSTFFTSMNAIEFQTNGTPQSSTVTAFTTAGTNLIAARPDLCVFSRPKFQKPATTPPTLIRAGTHTNISANHVPQKTSWLRSRRV